MRGAVLRGVLPPPVGRLLAVARVLVVVVVEGVVVVVAVRVGVAVMVGVVVVGVNATEVVAPGSAVAGLVVVARLAPEPVGLAVMRSGVVRVGVGVGVVLLPVAVRLAVVVAVGTIRGVAAAVLAVFRVGVAGVRATLGVLTVGVVTLGLGRVLVLGRLRGTGGGLVSFRRVPTVRSSGS